MAAGRIGRMGRRLHARAAPHGGGLRPGAGAGRASRRGACHASCATAAATEAGPAGRRTRQRDQAGRSAGGARAPSGTRASARARARPGLRGASRADRRAGIRGRIHRSAERCGRLEGACRGVRGGGRGLRVAALDATDLLAGGQLPGRSAGQCPRAMGARRFALPGAPGRLHRTLVRAARVSRRMSSDGELGPTGLVPQRYEEDHQGRLPVAAPGHGSVRARRGDLVQWQHAGRSRRACRTPPASSCS
jgi:hypothetical protein